MPFKELLPLVILTLGTFLLPVLISCLIYLLLLLKKKKFFETKISDISYGEPLHTDTPNFIISQCSNSTKENLSKGDLVSSFDQKSVENENIEMKYYNFKKFDRQSLANNPSTTLMESEIYRRGQISFMTLENDDEITEVRLSPNLNENKDLTYKMENDDEIKEVRFSPILNENKDLTNKSLSSHNATISKVADGYQANPEEAIDSTDVDFKQIEEEKTRSFKILSLKIPVWTSFRNCVKGFIINT